MAAERRVSKPNRFTLDPFRSFPSLTGSDRRNDKPNVKKIQADLDRGLVHIGRTNRLTKFISDQHEHAGEQEVNDIQVGPLTGRSA